MRLVITIAILGVIVVALVALLGRWRNLPPRDRDEDDDRGGTY